MVSNGTVNKVELLGLFAGTLTTVAFVPQVVKTWRSGSAKDISLLWLSVFTAGVISWFVYGFLLGSLPIIVANGVTIFLLGTLLIFKLRSGSR